MTQRILIGRGTQDRLTSSLTRRLTGIKNNYFWRLISKERAQASGKAVIEDEFKTLLRVGRDRIRYDLGRVSELPPEELERLVRWKNDYIVDWARIIDETRRAGA